MIGDRFVRDTKYGRISYTIVDIEYEWGMYGNLLETIYYKAGDHWDTVYHKSRSHFECVVKQFNTRRIPKGDIGNIQSYVPRHKFK
jgi:hypothetical protein